MDSLLSQICERYSKALDRIAAAVRTAGRDPGPVRLVVVTRPHPLEVVQATCQVGASIFGENYPEESVTKILPLQLQRGVE